MSTTAGQFRRQYFHGTRADLQIGDLIAVGNLSNYGESARLSWVYCTGTLDAAMWGAELSVGDGRERIYVVEPLGEITDDPNLTDKKFPGNPTLSYRSRDPLRVVGEVVRWHGHSQDQIQQMRDGLARLSREGTAKIID